MPEARLGRGSHARATRRARRGDRPGVLIGKDTRISGYLLEAALEAGLSAAGVDVYLCGPLPTPGVAYLTRALRLSAGIVISASHNPFEDNGIKFFLGGGAKLPDDGRASRSSAGMDDAARRACRRRSSARRAASTTPRDATSNSARARFRTSSTCTGWRIVVDCAHGAGVHVAPPVFHELGAEVDRDRRRAGRHSTSTPASARRIRNVLAEQVREHGADLGIALDGDGDRLVMADARRHASTTATSCSLRDRASTTSAAAQLAGGVVGTLMSNLGFEQALDARRHRARARARRRPLRARADAGARAGCSAARTRATSSASTSTRPATRIVAALAVLRALIEQKTTLAAATRRRRAVSAAADQRAGPRAASTGRRTSSDPRAERRSGRGVGRRPGRVLLRPSGTEPVLRVMVEARGSRAAGRTTHAQRRAVAAR